MKRNPDTEQERTVSVVVSFETYGRIEHVENALDRLEHILVGTFNTTVRIECSGDTFDPNQLAFDL